MAALCGTLKDCLALVLSTRLPFRKTQENSGKLVPVLRTVDIVLPGDFEEFPAKLVEGGED